MKTVFLDTNAYSDWVRSGRWAAEILTAEEVWISPVVLGELRVGFLGGGRTQENEALLQSFLQSPQVHLCSIGDESSKLYAELKHDLDKRGSPLPVNDIWIAASCLEQGNTLLTRDCHFEKLPQLRVRWPDEG